MMNRLKLVVLVLISVGALASIVSINSILAEPLTQPAQATLQETLQPTVPPPSLTIRAQDNGKTFTVPIHSAFMLDLPSGLYDIHYDSNVLSLLPNRYMAIIGHRLFEFYAVRAGTTAITMTTQPCAVPCLTPAFSSFSVTIFVSNTAPTATSPGTLSADAMIRLGLGIGIGLGLLVGLGVLNP